MCDISVWFPDLLHQSSGKIDLATVTCLLDICNTTQLPIYLFYKFAFRELTVYLFIFSVSKFILIKQVFFR